MIRGLFEWRYFLYLFPIHSGVIIFSVAPQPFPVKDSLKWALVILISYGITALAFAMARNFRKLYRTATHEILVACAIGAVRGFAILDLSLLLSLPTVKPYILRPLNSAVSVPLWLLVLHLIIGARREFQQEFHKMYVRTISSQIALAKNGARNTAEELNSRITAALEPLRKQFKNNLGTRVTTQQLAEEALIIRSFVDAEIRPLSHEIWRSKSFKPPRLAFSRLLAHSLLHSELPLMLVIFPNFVFSLVSLTTTYDFRTAVEMLIAVNIVVVPVSLLYKSIFPRHLVPNPLLNLTAILINVNLPPFIDEITGLNANAVQSQNALEAIGATWYFIMLIGFTAYQAVTRYYDSIRSIMEKQLSNLNPQSSAALDSTMRREFASYLHGEVQSELLSASMQMKQAADVGDIKLGKRALKRADEILKRDHQSYVVGQAISIERRLEKIAEAWQGIADIKLTIPRLSGLSDGTSGLLVDLVEELVANAVRHGKANKGSVLVEVLENEIALVFEDNGAAITSRKRGFGSDLLKKQTLSYAYERGESANKITISIPR